MTMGLLVALSIVCGIVGALLHEHRGHDRINGFIIGALFGVFGLAYIALRPAAPSPLPARTRS